MSYGFAAPVQTKPPISGTDLAVSVTALVLTFAGGGVAALLGLFMLAFTDHCPPETCSISGAVTAVSTGLLAAAVVAVLGTVVTIVALVRRARAWPFAIATLVLCALACVLGLLGYAAAVGA